jgi:hypothetical protein
MKATRGRIGQFGKGPATRYYLPRNLPSVPDPVPVWQVDEGGRVQRAGTLHLLAGGGHWLAGEGGGGRHFRGLPPFAVDMTPQGYLGSCFADRHPYLALPARIRDWNDDHCLLALARRGEDCVGNVILGEESLNRFLAMESRPVLRADYPELARTALTQDTGSSAGGEHPKFAAQTEHGHVLVKFVTGEGVAAERGRDLLVCESLAAEVVRAAGIEAAEAVWLDVGGRRFLEVRRFDRVGERGRRGVLSFMAIAGAYVGSLENWTKVARELLTEPEVCVAEPDVRAIRWLDVFGQLIGNTDRHFGNLSFFTEEVGPPSLRLAPVYDMLPMLFAPQDGEVVERPFQPGPPTADTLDVWSDAARWALDYWDRLVATDALSTAFRERCARCRDALSLLRERHG